MTFKLAFELPTAGMAQIQTMLKVLPKRIRNGAMRKAGKEAAAIVRRNVQPLVPQSGNRDEKSYMHLRQGIISKVKTYKNSVFVVVGPRSGAKLFHAHLIEFGTKPRYTRHTSKYQTIGTKRIKTRVNGKIQYRSKQIRRSTGSFLDQNKAKKGSVRFTGVGPAYNYMSRGWAKCEAGVVATIETELRKALATSGVTV